MARYAFAKRDANHSEVVQAFRELGCAVQDLAPVGQGCPDLLVSVAGKCYVVEVKADKGKLTADQMAWVQAWRSPLYICRSTSVAEALVAYWRSNLWDKGLEVVR